LCIKLVNYWDKYSKMPIKMCISKFESATRVQTAKSWYKSSNGCDGSTDHILPLPVYTAHVCWCINKANINTTTSRHTQKVKTFSISTTDFIVSLWYLPTHPPRKVPTYPPNNLPTYLPTHPPSNLPTYPPSNLPTYLPSNLPTYPPSNIRTYPPSNLRTYPTNQQTSQPTNQPTPRNRTLLEKLPVPQLVKKFPGF